MWKIWKDKKYWLIDKKINYKTILRNVQIARGKKGWKRDRKAYVFMKKYCYFPYLNVLCRRGFMAIKRWVIKNNLLPIYFVLSMFKK